MTHGNYHENPLEHLEIDHPQARLADSHQDVPHQADTLTTAEGDPVHSMNTLLADLTTICRNRVALRDKPEHEFTIITEPTLHQQRAFDLLGIKPDRI